MRKLLLLSIVISFIAACSKTEDVKITGNGKEVYRKKVEFFAWEKLDYVDKIKKAFS